MNWRGWKSERGTVLVEFAMVLPIFLVIVWGIIDFARAFYTANSLATAVREGARYGAVFDDPTTTASRDLIRAKVAAAFNSFGGTAIPTDSIFVIANGTGGSGGTMTTLTVRVRNYNWTTSTPIKLIANGTIKMTKEAVFRWEREPTT